MDVLIRQLLIVIVAELAALVWALAPLKVHGEFLALARDVAFQVLKQSKVGKYVKELFWPRGGIPPALHSTYVSAIVGKAVLS